MPSKCEASGYQPSDLLNEAKMVTVFTVTICHAVLLQELMTTFTAVLNGLLFGTFCSAVYWFASSSRTVIDKLTRLFFALALTATPLRMLYDWRGESFPEVLLFAELVFLPLAAFMHLTLLAVGVRTVPPTPENTASNNISESLFLVTFLGCTFAVFRSVCGPLSEMSSSDTSMLVTCLVLTLAGTLLSGLAFLIVLYFNRVAVAAFFGSVGTFLGSLVVLHLFSNDLQNLDGMSWFASQNVWDEPVGDVAVTPAFSSLMQFALGHAMAIVWSMIRRVQGYRLHLWNTFYPRHRDDS